jgi:hypothetical protein
MRALTALLPCLVACALAPAAGAATVAVGDQTRAQPYQSWLDASAMPDPPGQITVRLEPCPGGPAWASGCAVADTKTIYLGPDARSRDRFLHEVGHLFDEHSMRLAHRLRFRALIHDERPWQAEAAVDPPAEKFAEAYSVCARHREITTLYFGMYDYTPTPFVHDRVCGFIREITASRAAVRRAQARARARARD